MPLPHSNQNHPDETEAFLTALADGTCRQVLEASPDPLTLLEQVHRPPNFHGKLRRNLLGDAITANRLPDVVAALDNREISLTRELVEASLPSGLDSALCNSDAEQARALAQILKQSGISLSKKEIFHTDPDKPDRLSSFITTTPLPGLVAFLEEFGHALEGADLLQRDATGRSIFSICLSRDTHIEELITVFEQSGSALPRAALDEISVMDHHVNPARNGNSPLHTLAFSERPWLALKMPVAEEGGLSRKQLRELAHKIPSPELARQTAESPFWAKRRTEHYAFLGALLERNDLATEEWPRALIAKLQAAPVKAAMYRKRKMGPFRQRP